ncbi:hypothetical protein AMTRI_Chr09g12420 [Amborella trichopoda]
MLLGRRLLNLLEKCITMAQLKQAHAQFITGGLGVHDYVLSRLVAFCSNPNRGSLNYACLLFDQIENRPICIWNTMLKALLNNGALRETMKIYHRMLQANVIPDNYTLPYVLKACAHMCDHEFGVEAHDNALKLGFGSDPYVANTLILMYMACGRADSAIKVFNCSPTKTLVSWTVMVSGYAKQGDVHSARSMFEGAPVRDLKLWGAMVACYAQNNCSKEALQLFRLMQAEGIKPDEAILGSVLTACAQLGALDLGRWVHKYANIHWGMDLSIKLSTALVDMYAKCGSLKESKQLFDKMSQRDVVSWNVMIGGLAMHGDGYGAFALFTKMQQMGFSPNDLTFIALFTACSHSGLVEEGRELFEKMSIVYGIKPQHEHYACVVDFLSRAGRFQEAEEMLKRMHGPEEAIAWRAMLSASRNHRDIGFSELARNHLLQLEPHSGVYSLLSNIYAAAGKWYLSGKTMTMMKENGVSKTPGSSSIEVNGFVHEFVAGERKHPLAKEIRKMWGEINRQLRLEGYKPDISGSAFDVDEEEKESLVSEHSEKLAIAFGFMSHGPNVPIRVIKNLRVCGDCHSVTKLVSKVFGREIIVRDRIRFHHFNGGSCSCMDYW